MRKVHAKVTAKTAVIALFLSSCGGGSTPQSVSTSITDVSTAAAQLEPDVKTEPEATPQPSATPESDVNAESEVNGDGALAITNVDPEDPSCNTLADIDTDNMVYASQCMSYAAMRSEFIVTSNEGVSYFGDDMLRTLYIMDLPQNSFLPRINYQPQIGWENKLTALAYSNAHNRIYMGFSNGAILYSGSDNVVKTFSEFDHPIIALTEAGDHLSVQYESGWVGDSYPRHDLMDQSANVVSTMGGHFSNSNANSSFGVWNAEKKSISLINSDRLLSFSYEEDGFLGPAIYKKQFGLSDKKHPHILAVSPDGTTYVTSDLTIHDENNKNSSFETRLALPENANNNYELIWTATDGLFLLSENIMGGSLVVHYSNALEIVNTYEFTGDVDEKPMDMHVTEDSIFVLSQKYGSQMYVHSISL